MPSTPMPPDSPTPSVGGVLPARNPEAHQAHTQRKAQKKQRKLDRLLSFLSWCEGCCSYSNSV